MDNQEAIKELSEWLDGCCGGEEIEPTRQALRLAISALQAQEAKTQLSAKGTTSDLISRKDAIDALMDFDKKLRKINWYQYPHTEYECRGVDEAIVKIENVPSAQPKRKTGWWLIREGISDAQCSECKMYFRDVYDMDNSDAFCRHCGTKMEGLKVVEDE